jgi:hypothetical protein
MADIFPVEFASGEMQTGEAAIQDGVVQTRMVYRGNRTCFPAKVRILAYEEGTEPLYICMADNISNESFLEKKASQADQEAEAAQKVKTNLLRYINIL